MTRLRAIGLALGVIGAIVLVFAAIGNPFAPSVTERVSDKVGADAKCRDVGIQEVAGGRETIYRCSYRDPRLVGTPYTVDCFAVVGGRVYSVGSC